MDTDWITAEQDAAYLARKGETLGEQTEGTCDWCGGDCRSPRACPNGPAA